MIHIGINLDQKIQAPLKSSLVQVKVEEMTLTAATFDKCSFFLIVYMCCC